MDGLNIISLQKCQTKQNMQVFVKYNMQIKKFKKKTWQDPFIYNMYHVSKYRHLAGKKTLLITVMNNKSSLKMQLTIYYFFA